MRGGLGTALMPGWEDTVIANGVDALWRVDELADEHPTLSDSSGNGHHVTCYADDPLNPERHVHGFASPIETDASSRAMSGRLGPFTVPGAIDRRNTFAWGAWGFNATSSSPKTLLCRSDHWSSSNANILGFGSTGNAQGRLLIGSTFYQLSAPALFDTWYYLGLQYNAGVIQLLVNAVVVDEETGVVGDMDVTGSTTFTLGAQQGINTNIWHSMGVDEIHIGPAWTLQQWVDAYESALNATFLNGYSNVIPSAILYSEIEPDPIHFPFRHNWSNPLIERISFRTNVSKSQNGAEENSGLRPKPRREIEISQILRDDSDRRKLRAKLWANQNRKWFIPILEDREQLTSSLSAGAVAIPASTQYKDYKVGGYLELRQLNDMGRITKAEILEIESFTDSVITPVTEPVNDYDALVSTIGPARRGYLDTQIPIKGHTDSVEELTIVARLVAEDEETTPNRVTPWTPNIKYRDYEVFDPATWQSNDWTELREYEIDRNQLDVNFDTGTFGPESDTPGAEESFTYQMVIKGREESSAFLGWFYERAGSLHYLWVPTMQHDFEIVSASGTDLTVEGTEYSDNYALAEARRDLVFVYEDNSMAFRRVTGFSGTPDETLDLDALIPSLTNLRSVSLLKFCRLDGDTLEIAKVTDDLWKFAWRFREQLTTPAGTGVSSLSPSTSVSGSRSPSGSQSPSVSLSPSVSPSASLSPSSSVSPSSSQSPSSSVSGSASPSASVSPSHSASPST